MRLLCIFVTSLVTTKADLGLFPNLNFGIRNGFGGINNGIPNQVNNFANRYQVLNGFNEDVFKANQLRGISSLGSAQSLLKGVNGFTDGIQLNGQLVGFNKILNRVPVSQINSLQFRSQFPNQNVYARSGLPMEYQSPVQLNNQGLGFQTVAEQQFSIQKPLATIAPVSMTPQQNPLINPSYARVNLGLINQPLVNPIRQLNNLIQDGRLNSLNRVKTNFAATPSYPLRYPIQQQIARTQTIQTPILQGVNGNTVNTQTQLPALSNQIYSVNNGITGSQYPLQYFNAASNRNSALTANYNRNLMNNPLLNGFTPFNKGFANNWNNQLGNIQQTQSNILNPFNRFQFTNRAFGNNNNQASVGVFSTQNIPLQNNGYMNQWHNQIENTGHFNHGLTQLHPKDIQNITQLHTSIPLHHIHLLNHTHNSNFTHQNVSLSNATLHHQSLNNSSIKIESVNNETLATTVNVTSIASLLKNLTDKSAVLTDDGSVLRHHLVELNSTEEILSKWDSIVKEKGEKSQLNVTWFEKKDPFCSCNGTASCNCCLSLDLAVLKKEVCIEVADTASDNGTQITFTMDKKRQELPKYSGTDTNDKFKMEGLASGNFEITTPASSNDTSLQNFCASASLNLFGLNFPALPFGCYSRGNHSISISDSV